MPRANLAGQGLGVCLMRGLLRLLLLVGLVTGAGSLTPLASASPAPVRSSSVRAADGATTPAAPTTSEAPATPAGTPSGTSSTESGSAAPSPSGRSSLQGASPGATLDETTPPPTPVTPAPVVIPPTVIDSHPATSSKRSGTFTFHADAPLLSFECALVGRDKTPAETSYAPCTSVDPPTEGSRSSGTQTYTKPMGRYTFYVRAVLLPATGQVGETTHGEAAKTNWTVLCDLGCKVIAQDAYSIPTGARFNNPLGDVSANRRNLTHVIRAIKSMPGYVVPDRHMCPTSTGLFPAKIRITLYSVTDGRFARALLDAADRCVSVQMLMNNHLTPSNSHAVAVLEQSFGVRVKDADTGEVNTNFAHPCNYGCRGAGVLHTKFYTFDVNPDLPLQRVHQRHVIMEGSSNMTSNATKVQWNDLFTTKNSGLYSAFISMFDRMKKDQNEFKLVVNNVGAYQTNFWPQETTRADRTLEQLNSIKCSGANGGAGVAGGHSIVYINMHAWFGTRGYTLAKRVRTMYDHGCTVRVLYSFMSHSVFLKLKSGTGSRMSVRRTIFSDDGDQYADVYSHMKAVAVSGYVGNDRSAWVVWNGSHNFTNGGLKYDELTMRIASRSIYGVYRDHFQFMSRRKSSATYATYLEPVGGGRPDAETKAARTTATFAAQQQEVIHPDLGSMTEDGVPVD